MLIFFYDDLTITYAHIVIRLLCASFAMNNMSWMLTLKMESDASQQKVKLFTW